MDVACSDRGGRVLPVAPPVIFRRVRLWCTQAERALANTFDGELEVIRELVDLGRFDLYEIDDGRAWMVTRIDGDVLTICCYQGRDLARDAPLVIAAARRRGLGELGFLTRRPALGRMLARFGFAAVGTSDQGHTIFRMKL